jgi:acyl carrier protein
MSSDESLELEIKNFLVETLALEDIKAEEIAADQPLFGDGLGLDSVDALEIGVALQKTYGIKLDPKDDATRDHFASVRTLTKLVSEKRA